MPSKTAAKVRRKTTTEERSFSVSFAPELKGGDLLTGTPTITVLPSSGAPTFTDIERNSAVKTINGKTVAANQAVTAMAVGGTAGTYAVTVTCQTVAGQTIDVICTLQVQNS